MPDQQKIMIMSSAKNQGILLWYSYKKNYCVHSSDEKTVQQLKEQTWAYKVIKLLSNVFTEHVIEVHLATDDADTMVASKALNLSFTEDVEVKAEDTDILCLLIHHFTENHNEIVMTTRNGSHSISKIVNALDANIKHILLFVHSFSGCDTVSSIQ